MAQSRIVRTALQLRVLRLGFLKDGDIGVGVFPESKEIFVGGECLPSVIRNRGGAGQTQVGQRAEDKVSVIPGLFRIFWNSVAASFPRPAFRKISPRR